MPNATSLQNASPPVIDYEGSDYRARFWENQGRIYEDQVERIALRALMPASGDTLIEVGAGFGRLANEYNGYQRVVLFDYSRSLLREAQQMLGDDPRFIYVAGNWYNMPFVDDLFATMVQIRTIHHAADVPALFAELRRIAQPRGSYILEFANKRNIKAMLRHALGKQEWSPYDREPIEFAELNFDFHPQWMRHQLEKAMFHVKQQRTVSHFRLNALKKAVPSSLLINADKFLQPTGNWFQFTPSVFSLCKLDDVGERADSGAFFACPACRQPLPAAKNDQLQCACGKLWRLENNLYDFKEPLA